MYSLTPVLYSVPYLALPEVGVNLLEDGNAEGGRLAGAGLCLSNNVVTLDAGHDGALLDGRGLLEAVGVDAAEELLAKGHIVEVLADVVPVGVDETLRVHAGGPVITRALARGRPRAVGGPGRFVSVDRRPGKKVVLLQTRNYTKRSILVCAEKKDTEAQILTRFTNLSCLKVIIPF